MDFCLQDVKFTAREKVIPPIIQIYPKTPMCAFFIAPPPPPPRFLVLAVLVLLPLLLRTNTIKRGSHRLQFKSLMLALISAYRAE
jgi:hypothetical protein